MNDKRNGRGSHQLTVEQYNIQLGKIPPQAVDIEKAILGAMMLENDCFALNPLNPEIFYNDAHQKICETIKELSNSGKRIDLLTVTIRLREKGLLEDVGGPVYITELTRHVASAAHIQAHIAILRDKYLRREIIRMANELTTAGYDETIELEEAISAVQQIFMTAMEFEEEAVKKFDKVVLEIADRMVNNINGENLMTGLRTGFDEFDNFSYGIQPTDFVVIGGETSNGKTSLAINMVKHIAENGTPVAFYSLEMGAIQLGARILAIETGIPAKEILFSKIQKEAHIHVEKGIYKVKDIPIYFDERSTSSVTSICNSIRRMVLKYGIRLAVIDYLQLVSGDQKHGREEEVGQLARTFKNLAKELKISIIALSQLARSESHVPTMKRLRASGQIEEAVDIAILIWIPEVSGITWIKDAHGNEIDMTGKADFIVAKGRNIGIMNFSIKSIRETGKMCSIKPEPFQAPTANFKYTPDPNGWINSEQNDVF